MDSKRLEEIETLAAAGIKGPWEHHEHGDHPSDAFRVYISGVPRIEVIGDSAEAFETAAFIPAARTAIPELVAAVRERDDEVERLRPQIAKLSHCVKVNMASESRPDEDAADTIIRVCSVLRTEAYRLNQIRIAAVDVRESYRRTLELLEDADPNDPKNLQSQIRYMMNDAISAFDAAIAAVEDPL